MRIISKGDLSRLDKVIRFTCEECGCVFEASKEEYSYDYYQRDDTTLYWIRCPVCNHVIDRTQKDVEFVTNENGFYTSEEFADQMKKITEEFAGDCEQKHMEMDALLCNQHKSLGYEEGIKIFEDTYKWYS